MEAGSSSTAQDKDMETRLLAYLRTRVALKEGSVALSFVHQFDSEEEIKDYANRKMRFEPEMTELFIQVWRRGKQQRNAANQRKKEKKREAKAKSSHMG